jgi:hypothetical protein
MKGFIKDGKVVATHGKKYILLLILNSDDVVMSSGNSKFSIMLFEKCGALQFSLKSFS